MMASWLKSFGGIFIGIGGVAVLFAFLSGLLDHPAGPEATQAIEMGAGGLMLAALGFGLAGLGGMLSSLQSIDERLKPKPAASADILGRTKA
jgi:hypothetical protein